MHEVVFLGALDLRILFDQFFVYLIHLIDSGVASILITLSFGW